MVFNKRHLLGKYHEEDKSVKPVSVDESWIIKNPGQQNLVNGSFDPIHSTLDDWLGRGDIMFSNFEHWKREAERRTHMYETQDRKGKTLPDVYWVLSNAKNVPKNAIPLVTRSNGTISYAARTFDKNQQIVMIIKSSITQNWKYW
ncbi:hypothetical protein BC833DRAFT_208231 [Globomyces pollinis-pini]|nr:hypothetical protein BC833DRAFT_208231 [Globomyces pollinis-pini]